MSLRKGETIIAGIPDVTSKANTDLDNLTDTGKKVIDGQWIFTIVYLEDGTNLAAGSYDYDLTDYLPDDDYKYEVLISVYGRTGTTSGNYFAAWFQSGLMTTPICITGANTRASNYSLGYGSAIIPISADRELNLSITGNGANSAQIKIAGYRRIGTNE